MFPNNLNTDLPSDLSSKQQDRLSIIPMPSRYVIQYNFFISMCIHKKIRVAIHGTILNCRFSRFFEDQVFSISQVKLK